MEDQKVLQKNPLIIQPKKKKNPLIDVNHLALYFAPLLLQFFLFEESLLLQIKDSRICQVDGYVWIHIVEYDELTSNVVDKRKQKLK